jgi:hypothetical protein
MPNRASIYNAYGFLINVTPANGPVVTIISIDHQKISDEVGIDSSHITFKCDIDISQWTMNVGGVSWDTGTIADSNTTVTAGTQVIGIVVWNKLSEGNNRINIYGKSASGVWTQYGT